MRRIRHAIGFLLSEQHHSIEIEPRRGSQNETRELMSIRTFFNK